MASGYRFGAGLFGTKTILVGADPSSFQYNNLADAVAAAAAGDTIVVTAGTYTISTVVTFNKPGVKVVGLGRPKFVNASTLTTAMIAIDPVVHTAAHVIVFEGIDFAAEGADYGIFTINNIDQVYAQEVRFVDCSLVLYSASSTQKAITKTHTATSYASSLTVVGRHCHQVDTVTITPGHASDVYKFQGVYMTENGNASAIISSGANKACKFLLLQVGFKTAAKATTGGHSSQTILAYGCWTESTGVELVTGDLAGSHTETDIAP